MLRAMTGQPPRREPTIRDVARAAGVSSATAARALGGYGRVSAAARERVLAAATNVGYRANTLARSMITGTTHTLGVVVADIENPFFASIVRAISDTAHARGFEVMVTNSDEDLGTERAVVRVLFEKRVDGLIIAPAASEHGEHLAELLARGLPIVLIDRTVTGLAVDAVVVDNRRAAREAVSHLTALGHRRIAVVTGSPPESQATRRVTARDRDQASFTISSTSDRLAGYFDALGEAGIEPEPGLIRYARYRRDGAQSEVHAVLDLPDPPTALFATDNFMTLGAFEAMRESGCEIPGDVSLVGFDDMDWTTIVSPRITLVAQPTSDIGTTAAERLLARLGGDRREPIESVLRTTFQSRESTAPPSR